MTASLWQVLIFLLAGIAVIIILTARFHIHAFFSLLIAAFLVGLGVNMPFAEILTVTKQGFGNILQSLGFIIVLGTTLGVLLEHTGSTRKMASWILKKTGEHKAATALSITGYVVGLPVFCDSGFIVLSGLNKSLARKTGISLSFTSVSLATGLYAVHCLIPPHPGASTAAITLNVDFGKLILAGMAVAIPALIAGRWWAGYAGKKIMVKASDEHIDDTGTAGPSVISSFLPVIVPIILIGFKALLTIETKSPSSWQQVVSILGDPVVALFIGVLLVVVLNGLWKKVTVSKLLMESVEKAGGILVIIGAGGAFGAVLAATKIGQHLSDTVDLHSLGIFFPFLLTFILKTAQGSSTVAIITAASIIQPMLPALGLNSESGRLLTVLSMGAGSMMISHANDAY